MARLFLWCQMTKGHFRVFPVIDKSASRLLFALVTYRMLFIRIRNHLKGVLKPRRYCIENTSEAEKSITHYMSLKKPLKLNIGGGNVNLKGFVNIDFVKHDCIENEIVANILDLSFIPAACVSHIHTNHVLEHLTQEQLVNQLYEYNRMLTPGGVLTLRCPNILGVCYGFWFGAVPETRQETFVELGYPSDEKFYNREDGWYVRDIYGLVHYFYGDVGNPENQHLNLLTPSKLTSVLVSAGFNILNITEPEATNIIIVAKKP